MEGGGGRKKEKKKREKKRGKNRKRYAVNVHAATAIPLHCYSVTLLPRFFVLFQHAYAPRIPSTRTLLLNESIKANIQRNDSRGGMKLTEAEVETGKRLLKVKF